MNDETLNIQTSGQICDYADKDHQRYQPTFWNVLEKIVKSGFINKDSFVVDYGCGKGRVAFYLNTALGCDVTGIEFAEPIYQMAEANLDNYGRDKGVRFIHANAEEYEPVGADIFYFFNPFSTQIVEKCLQNILAQPTSKYIVFYWLFPHIERLLRENPRLKVVWEEDCRIPEDNRSFNKFMIFKISK